MLKAPDGCLQFHTNISGNVKSFNYKGVGCFSNDHVCDPDNLESCEFVAGDDDPPLQSMNDLENL